MTHLPQRFSPCQQVPRLRQQDTATPIGEHERHSRVAAAEICADQIDKRLSVTPWVEKSSDQPRHI